MHGTVSRACKKNTVLTIRNQKRNCLLEDRKKKEKEERKRRRNISNMHTYLWLFRSRENRRQVRTKYFRI